LHLNNPHGIIRTMSTVGRSKVCAYRHCGKTFEDASKKNSLKFCCPEHRRREKLFRLGLAKDESYFRAEKDTGWRKCQQCGGLFKRESGKSTRCPSCLEINRRKDCRQCGQKFQDESSKNTRRFCHACQTTGEVRARVSERTGESRRGRVRRKEGGRLDVFRSLKPLSQTWWGRVGEVLFLHAYPDAADAIEGYGNKSPFDAQHRELGRVSVKTVQARGTPHGRPAWFFQINGVNRNSDTAFWVGLSAARDHVEQVWLVPSRELPHRLKVLSPGSQEYLGLPWERKDLVPVLDRKLQSILSSTTKADPLVQEDSRVEYERNILGRIGEAVYKRLYPLSTHVAGTDPLAPLDFRDPDGASVNVRLRRRTGRDRWTFFRSSSPVDDYFFVGLDPEGRMVEALLRVPSKEMPAHGFSVRPTGISKWDAFRKTPLPLPLPVADFVGLPDLEATHVRITSLNHGMIQGMSPAGVEELLDQAARYHRFLGFPFPAVPSDKRLASDIQRLRAYGPRGKDLPVENAGLGTCSAYMPHRFEARNNDADFSALGAFEDDARLRRALQFCLRGRAPNLTRRGLRSVLTALNRTPTGFRPAVAKALVESYSPEGGLVLDPCAGWGGRLMGTLVAGRPYLGVDPDKRTADALFRLGSRICEHLHLDRHLVQVIEGPIQSIPRSLAKAAFALTSPPYWVKEVYDGASGIQPLEEWFRDFLCPMFEVTAGLLAEGARFAVNVSDVVVRGKKVALEQLTLEAAKLSGFCLEGSWRMLKASFGEQPEGRFEPIFVFRK
jgi:hypothetical protein